MYTDMLKKCCELLLIMWLFRDFDHLLTFNPVGCVPNRLLCHLFILSWCFISVRTRGWTGLLRQRKIIQQKFHLQSNFQMVKWQSILLMSQKESTLSLHSVSFQLLFHFIYFFEVYYCQGLKAILCATVCLPVSILCVLCCQCCVR